ncbi:potassium channel family protein [Conexibacter sp. SYSU D00693]|uniref:potassium channel family protein n=1 Tax=Conexibacter sp. SYSU D00693 TaxID=2812560 RepID=UPI00196B5DB0|nr:potassium channel family protein [Conexibacter sp. SYSU D00693]
MDERSRSVERAFATPLMVLALLVIPVVAIEESETRGWLATTAEVTDWIIWTAFAAEAIAMLAVVPDRRAWLRSHPLEVAIVVLTVPAFTALLPAIRALRALRLLRLVRVAPLAKQVFSVTGLRYASIVAVLAILGGGEAYAAAEDVPVGDGIYFAITTATTVGYGDIAPETTVGKAVSVVVMLVGIGLVAVLTGAVAERFLSRDVEALETTERAADQELRAELRQLRTDTAELRAALTRIEARLEDDTG